MEKKSMTKRHVQTLAMLSVLSRGFMDPFETTTFAYEATKYKGMKTDELVFTKISGKRKLSRRQRHAKRKNNQKMLQL